MTRKGRADAAKKRKRQQSARRTGVRMPLVHREGCRRNSACQCEVSGTSGTGDERENPEGGRA